MCMSCNWADIGTPRAFCLDTGGRKKCVQCSNAVWMPKSAIVWWFYAAPSRQKEALRSVTHDVGTLPWTECRSQWHGALYHSIDSIISSFYICRMEVLEYIKVNNLFYTNFTKVQTGNITYIFASYNMKFYESTCKMFVRQLAILERSPYATNRSFIVSVYTGKHEKLF